MTSTKYIGMDVHKESVSIAVSGKSVNQEFAYRRIVVCLRSFASRFPERPLAGVSPALPGWITCEMAI